MSRRVAHDLEVYPLKAYLNDTGAAAVSGEAIAWRWEVSLHKSVCSWQACKLTCQRWPDFLRSFLPIRRPQCRTVEPATGEPYVEAAGENCFSILRAAGPLSRATVADE